MTSLHGGATSDMGRARRINQDDMLLSERLYAVADGMGGHQGGEVASALAVRTLRDTVTTPTAEALVSGTHAANAAIFARAEDDPNLRGMGTTLCGVVLVDTDDGAELVVVNVGDSRVYLFRDQALTQITRDHSLVEDLRQEGRLSEEELAVHPHRNVITRALGIAPTVEVDQFTVIPHKGDRLVLCSDGLFNEVPHDRIAATLRRLADPQDASQELVRQANQNGGRDNITCIVVDVITDGDADHAAAVAAPPRSGKRNPTQVTDLVGFSAAAQALDEAAADATGPSANDHEPSADDARKDRRRKPRSSDEPRVRRVTWRVGVFAVLLVVVLAAVVGIVGKYAQGSYYVGLDSSGQVTVFQGRAKPFLWFKAKAVEHTGIAEVQIPAAFHDAVSSGKEWGSRSQADQYVANIRTGICRELAAAPAPSDQPAPDPTTQGSAPTTTIPRDCAPSSSTTANTTTTTVAGLPSPPGPGTPTTVAATAASVTAAPVTP